MKTKILCLILIMFTLLTACGNNVADKTVGLPEKETEFRKDPVAKNFSWIISNGTLTIKGDGAMPDFGYESPVPWENEKENISKVIIKSGISHIGNEAFRNCNNLTDVYIPQSVTSIGDHAFQSCDNIRSVSIPRGVTYIGDYCFGECKYLTSIVIYEKVNHIGDRAFYWCDSLAEISVESTNKNYLSENGVLFNKDKTVIIRYPPNKNETSYIIPDSVTRIENGAFDRCHNLRAVSIPDSLTTIGYEAFEACNLSSISIPHSVTTIESEAFWGCGLTYVYIPANVTLLMGSAFENCDSLTEICVDSSNPNYTSEDGVLFSKDKKTLLLYPGGKPDKSYSVPQGVTEIRGYAFTWNEKITSVSIPDGVTHIDYNTFWQCKNLISIDIPASITSIGDAFSDCKNLKKINFSGTIAQWKAIEKNDISENALTIICTDGTITE